MTGGPRPRPRLRRPLVPPRNSSATGGVHPRVHLRWQITGLRSAALGGRPASSSAFGVRALEKDRVPLARNPDSVGRHGELEIWCNVAAQSNPPSRRRRRSSTAHPLCVPKREPRLNDGSWLCRLQHILYLRRTMIGNLLEVGADIATVQRLAGHASPDTTARYDRRPAEVRRKAARLRSVPNYRLLRGRLTPLCRNPRRAARAASSSTPRTKSKRSPEGA